MVYGTMDKTGGSVMIKVKVFVHDVFLCTIPENKIEGMFAYLRRKGITNVTISE
jgi:hypothetical protein